MKSPSIEMTSCCLFHIYVKHNKNPDPRIPDPYESRLVEVRSSEIEGGNEGLFAKQFLEVNQFSEFEEKCFKLPVKVAYFSGEHHNIFLQWDPGTS